MCALPSFYGSTLRPINLLVCLASALFSYRLPASLNECTKGFRIDRHATPIRIAQFFSCLSGSLTPAMEFSKTFEMSTRLCPVADLEGPSLIVLDAISRPHLGRESRTHPSVRLWGPLGLCRYG